MWYTLEIQYVIVNHIVVSSFLQESFIQRFLRWRLFVVGVRSYQMYTSFLIIKATLDETEECVGAFISISILNTKDIVC